MAVFMPQDRLPVVFDLKCRRGVCGDDLAEAHAEESFAARKSEGANSKISLFSEQVYNDRFTDICVVFFFECCSCLGEDLSNSMAK